MGTLAQVLISEEKRAAAIRMIAAHLSLAQIRIATFLDDAAILDLADGLGVILPDPDAPPSN